VLLVALVPRLALQYLTWRDSRDERREASSAAMVADRLEEFHWTSDLIVPMTVEMQVTGGVVRANELGAEAAADAPAEGDPTISAGLGAEAARAT